MPSPGLAVVIFPKMLRLGAQEKDTFAGLQSYSLIFENIAFLEFDSKSKNWFQ
jgi:hypothetical protein